MDTPSTVDVLLHANQLKRTARTGWVQRGVPDAENVAAHSYGVAFTAMLLGQLIEKPINLDRVMSMAVLHDLPEGLTSDIPTPSWRFMPAGAKVQAEESSMREILGNDDFSAHFLDLWHEFVAQETTESRLVHDADKVDLYLQAMVYQVQTGNRQLAEFWSKPAEFHFPQSGALYEEIKGRLK